MCGLVRNYVMCKTGKDGLSVQSREVSEKNSPIIPGIEGICIGEGMRRYMNLVSIGAPGDAAAERKLETRQRTHNDGIYILRMESGIHEQGIFAACPASLRWPEWVSVDTVAQRRIDCLLI